MLSTSFFTWDLGAVVTVPWLEQNLTHFYVVVASAARAHRNDHRPMEGGRGKEQEEEEEKGAIAIVASKKKEEPPCTHTRSSNPISQLLEVGRKTRKAGWW